MIGRPMLLLAALLATSGARAEERLAIQLAAGYTRFETTVNVNTTFSDAGQTSNFTLPLRANEQDVSWEAVLSYRIWRNVRLQGGYVDLGTFTSETVLITTSTGTQGPGTPSPANVSISADAPVLGVEYALPLSDEFSLHVRAAALWTDVQTRLTLPAGFSADKLPDDNGWALGVGARYRIVPRVSLGLAFTRYDVDVEALDSFQATLKVDLL